MRFRFPDGWKERDGVAPSHKRAVHWRRKPKDGQFVETACKRELDPAGWKNSTTVDPENITCRKCREQYEREWLTEYGLD